MLCRHLSAGFGTAATFLCTSLHLCIIAELFTVDGASLTDLGTDGTDPPVQLRSAQHEVRTRLTDLYTIQKQTDMSRCGVLTTLFEAMGHSLQTDMMAISACLDAFLHRVTDMRHMNVLSSPASRNKPSGYGGKTHRYPTRL